MDNSSRKSQQADALVQGAERKRKQSCSAEVVEQVSGHSMTSHLNLASRLKLKHWNPLLHAFISSR